jgi:predicted enzyme related to lactoylglutathione lyase
MGSGEGQAETVGTMSAYRASRDVIIRTEEFAEAARFYESVLGLKKFHDGKSLMGFDTGAFRLFVERGAKHGPVFDFLVPDLEAAKRALLTEGCCILEEDLSVPRCYVRDPHGLVFNIEQRGEE